MQITEAVLFGAGCSYRCKPSVNSRDGVSTPVEPCEKLFLSGKDLTVVREVLVVFRYKGNILRGQAMNSHVESRIY